MILDLFSPIFAEVFIITDWLTAKCKSGSLHKLYINTFCYIHVPLFVQLAMNTKTHLLHCITENKTGDITKKMT